MLYILAFYCSDNTPSSHQRLTLSLSWGADPERRLFLVLHWDEPLCRLEGWGWGLDGQYSVLGQRGFDGVHVDGGRELVLSEVRLVLVGGVRLHFMLGLNL